MIEEPKETGPYWMRHRNGSSFVAILDRWGYFRNTRNGHRSTFRYWVELVGVVAIEPVTPPSWERKP